MKGPVPPKAAAFIESVRTKSLLNEVPGGVESTLAAILGRTAAYEGREKAWDEMAGSHARWKEKWDLSPLAPRQT